MADDDATKQDTPSTTDEPQNTEDVRGHAHQRQRPDRDVSAPRSTEDGKPDPVENGHSV
jgi:hypothetical protein